MEEKYCQSCGIPMGNTGEFYGTNADGSKNTEYCSYCFDSGKFTGEMTMDEMIELCVPHMAEAHPEMTEEKARQMMKEFFPHLKRWKKD